MNTSYFYHDKPVFGLDIGFSSLKVLQLEPNAHGKGNTVTGYGVTHFDSAAIDNGVIKDPELIAKSALDLFEKNIVGDITSRRVAVAIPATRTYTRTMTLPAMKTKDLQEAVRLEAEQYIPVPLGELYLDYEVITQTDKETELLAVGVPTKIIDSYMQLVQLLGLEAIAMEPTISAAGRLFTQTDDNDTPTVLIDFGSISADLTIFDQKLIVTGTVQGGGDNFTELIAKSLKVTTEEAAIIKTKYGLGVSKKQAEIVAAIDPVLKQLVKEIRRMIRYYEERSGNNKKIGQIVTMGGGANMPGLSEYLTSTLRLAVRMCDPWQQLQFGDLQPPGPAEKSMYVTVAGLALINPKEVFTHD